MNHHHCGWIESIAKRLGAKGFIPGKGNHSYGGDKTWEKALELILS